MKRAWSLVAAVILWGLLWAMPTSTWAVDAPHDTLTNSIHCMNCHVTHKSLGDIITAPSDSLISTLCISCHTWGGWPGMGLPFADAMKAIPGTSGSSHGWDVDTANAEYQTHGPTLAAVADHLRSGKVTCTTCHDPHDNSNPHFLRVDNASNALCLACHNDRNISDVRTYVPGTTYSHPVGVVLPATSSFHNPPLDTDGNPQPSDGNATNDFLLGAGGEVYCTSCHGVHYTDSDPGTVDGP